MSDSIGVLFKLLLDKTATASFKKEVASVAKPVDELGDDFKKFTNQTKESAKATKEETEEIKKLNKEIADLAKLAGVSEKVIERIPDGMYKAGVQTLRLAEKLAVARKEMERLNKTSQSLQSFGRSASIFGAATVGGIFALGSREASRQQDEGKITKTTQQWLRANQRIEKSMQSIGASAEKAMLPVLKIAATAAEKVARIIEKHPGILKAGLSIGLIASTVGGLALVASKGIKMYADLKWILANQQFAVNVALFRASVHEMTLASGKSGGLGLAKKVGAGVAGLTGGAGVVSIAATVATVLAVIAAGATLGTIVYDLLAKKFGLTRLSSIATGAANIAGRAVEKVSVATGENSPEEAQRKTMVFTYLVGRVFGAIKAGDPAWKSVVDGAKKAKNGMEDLGETMVDTGEGAKVLADLRQDEAEADRRYVDDRAEIFRDSEQSLAENSANLRDAFADISAGLASSLSKINQNLQSTLAELSSSYALDTQADAQEFQRNRVKLARDGSAQIQEIHEKAQRDLEEAEREHTRNVADLSNERDALALIDEQQAFEDKKNEIRNGSDEATQQARENTKEQLRELAENYALQRQQRAQEYARQVQEAQLRAVEERKQAIAQAAEAKANALRDFKERQDNINRERVMALEDLKRNFNNERRERVLAAYQTLKDLGNALSSEITLRRQYNDIILADIRRSIATQLTAAGSSIRIPTTTKTIGSRATGGYVNAGMYQMHNSEFVANAETTKKLEQVVGGNLNQSNLLQAVGGTSITWNDYRKFDADVSASTRQAIASDTIAIINSAMKKAQR